MTGRLAVLLLLVLASNCQGNCQDDGSAWIEERFATSIMRDDEIIGSYQFPIVGFEESDGVLYVVTYGCEPQPVLLEKKGEHTFIKNFDSTINSQVWPQGLEEVYRHSEMIIDKSKDTIRLSVCISGEWAEYRYISNLDDSRFRSVLEMQGWLLNYLIPELELPE